MNKKIRKILEAAIQAPSGDNCQPWRFAVQGLTINLYNCPERDQSLYNFQQRASLVAHGAVLENLELAAVEEGFKVSIILFPDKEQPELVAQVDLAEDVRRTDPLEEAIYRRCTNRGSFAGGKLNDTQTKVMISCAEGYDGARVVLATENPAKNQLAAIAAKNDWLVFANRPLHQFLFEQIRWNQTDTIRTRDGLDVETLALSRADRLGFPNLRHWPLVNFLNRFGLAHMIGRKAQQLCRQSAGLGAVIVTGSQPEDFVLGGRVMERVWLRATAHNLQFQPYAGIAFLLQQVREGGTGDLTLKSVAALRQVQSDMQQLFGLTDDEVVVMYFRVGEGAAPAGRSIRHRLDDLLI